jgi:CRISPR type IV-associated DEAD/DEAH-box helicase Csf4
VSATMYAFNEEGEYRCDYLRVLLNLPLARVSTPSPVREKHLTEIPTLHMPSKELAAQLIPPAERNTELEDLWHRSVARIITDVGSRARGGTLVLCTAYADTEGLAKLLAPVFGERLVIQTPGRRFQGFKNDFCRLHAKGLRPILLGVGVAWTGVDFSDSGVVATEDFLLTDLIITRLPVSLNQSLSMQQRISGMGLYPLINEALLTLKQGLGRLVRRDGVQDRHIWFLDGRAHPSFTWQGMQRLTAGARRMLRDYRRVEEIAS